MHYSTGNTSEEWVLLIHFSKRLLSFRNLGLFFTAFFFLLIQTLVFPHSQHLTNPSVNELLNFFPCPFFVPVSNVRQLLFSFGLILASCSFSRLTFFACSRGPHTKSEWCRFNFQSAVFLSSLMAPTVWACLWSVRFELQNLQTQHQENTVKYFLFQYFFAENYVWHAYNLDKGWKWKRRKEIVK